MDLLFQRTWWQYRSDGDFFSHLYHYFNLFEAAVWLVLGALVLVRWARCRQSLKEIAYGVAFLLFGISDMVEAWWLTSWLLLAKLAVLILLFSLRRHVIKTYYPAAKLY